MSLRNETSLDLKPADQMADSFLELVHFGIIGSTEHVLDPKHPEQWIVDLEEQRVKLSGREATAFLLGATATLKRWKQDIDAWSLETTNPRH